MGLRWPNFRHEMGFKVGQDYIPDPSEFSGADSALDTEGGRDATGHLHRNMVATKRPLHIKWTNAPWPMISYIMQRVKDAQFQFSFPNPSTCAIDTIVAYAGDREWDVKWAEPDHQYIGTLEFSVIEY